jgi:hypothetical protein
MKFFAFLILLLPVAMFGQTRGDYEGVMAKFQRFYNEGQGDNISAMFSSTDSKFLWSNKKNIEYLEKFGTLNSFKFLGIDTLDSQKVRVFKTRFTKAGERITSLTLDKDNRLGTFRLMSRSKGITQLLKKDKTK